MRRIPLATTLVTTLSLPIALSAQQGNEAWQYFPAIEQASGNLPATLVFGFPETDLRAIRVFCAASEGGQPTLEVLFSANVGSLNPTDQAPLRWETALGSAMELGEVVIGDQDEGILLNMELGSILMGQLATAQQLTYSVASSAGLPQITVPLTAGQANVPPFHRHARQSTPLKAAAPWR